MPPGENADETPGVGPIAERTRAWVLEQLRPGERIEAAVPLYGGWTSDVRRLEVSGPDGRRSLVLRSMNHPLFDGEGEGMLTREAGVLRLLEASPVPAAVLVAVDAAATHCEHPSLLMSCLPGEVRLSETGAGDRADLLARQLVTIHRIEPGQAARPRPYEPWITPDRVRVPAASERPELWKQVVQHIRREPPDHRACFLHRDYHPGNVLFAGEGRNQRVSGVVDWVETSWGPPDLDVAHCSTNLAFLHGIPAGMSFAQCYVEAGGTLCEDPRAHLYWRLLDALSFADGEKVAEPWRALGRTDLDDQVVATRLEDYLQALVDRYAA